MKFTYQNISTIKLDLFANKLVYVHNENDANVKLPLEVRLVSEATSYINKQQCLLDNSPTTLGYYWINGDKCLRTRGGLVFKTVKEEESIQAQFNTNDNTLIYQNIDWQKSIKPTEEKEYKFNKIAQVNGLLNKSGDNTWYLKIGDREFTILKNELAFSFTHNYETGFELIEDSIFYYDNLLKNVDIDSFNVLNCNYAIDKNSVFCGNDTLKNVDIATFEALTFNLAKDKNQVYRFSKQLQHVDVSTFKIINSMYLKDKNNIYSHNFPERKVCESDASFKDLTNGYFKLKNIIYYYNEYSSVKVSNDSNNFKILPYGFAKDSTTLFLGGEEIYQGDTASVKFLNEHYFLVNKKIFWRNKEIINADADTFITDVCDFAMDKNQIYHAGKQIKGSDPSSFEQLNKLCYKDKNNIFFLSEYEGMYCIHSHIKNIDTSNIEFLQSLFFRNNTVVYWGTEQIVGADPLTFEVVQVPFSRDKNSVYCLEKKLLGLNPQEFNFLSYHFVCDKNYVFYNDHKLNLNAKYSVLLTDNFIKDQNSVYYENNIIEGADAESFQVICYWFQKDKYRLFHRTTPLELNPNTVKIEHEIYAFDEHHVYFSNHKVKGVDIASFQVLNGNFSKDRFHVYYKEKILEGVDAPSFQVIDYAVFQDENNVYTFKQGKFVIDRKLKSVVKSKTNKIRNKNKR